MTRIPALRRSTAALPWLLTLLAGCDKVTDIWEGATAPLVAEGIILGVEAPESDAIDLSGTDYSEGTGLTLFLATAESADQLEEAPVEGATVVLSGPAGGDVTATDAGGGVYQAGPSADIVYAANQRWTVEVEAGEDAGTSTVELPPPADVSVPEDHTAGVPIELDVTGQGFTSLLIVVIEPSTGTVTYSTEPQDIRDVYELTRGNEEVGAVEVPGSAFPDESVYALGVAGMIHNGQDDHDGRLNMLMTSILAGKMRFYPVITADLPAAP